jgi:AcrR family transcriptional regulator
MGNSKKQKPQQDVTSILLEEGRKHFLLYGSKGLSIRRITVANKINLGTFVYHFKNKETFVRRIIENSYAEFLTMFNAELEKIEPTVSPLEKFERLLTMISMAIAEKYQLIGRLILDICAGEKIILNAFAKEPPRHVIVIMETIVECQKKHLIRSDMTPPQVYIMCMSPILGSVVLARKISDGTRSAKAKQFANSVIDPSFDSKRIDFVMKGLRI